LEVLNGLFFCFWGLFLLLSYKRVKMKVRTKLIQLFSDEVFFKKLEIQLLEFEEVTSLQEISGNIFFSYPPSVNRDIIFLVDSKIITQYSNQLLSLSVLNIIVYVYSDEVELLQNSNVDLISDRVLPYDFSTVLLKSTLNSCKKQLETNEQVTHSFPRKLMGGVSNILIKLDCDSKTRIFFKNEHSQYIGCNQFFANDFNLGSSFEIIGKCDRDLMNEENVIAFSIADNCILRTGESLLGIETEISFKTGIKRVKINRFPIKDRAGFTRSIIGNYELVIKEKDDETNQFSDQRLLQFLMDNITDTIYFKDIESKFVRINKAQANLIGAKSPEDAIGKTDFDFFNIEHSKKAFSEERRIISDTKPINSLEYVGTKDGKYRWLNSSKVPIFDNSGQIIGIAGITRDIDKMMKVEHRLKAERDLLQLLIDNIPSPIYFKDSESKFTRVNLAQLRLLGANSSEDILGKSDFDFYSEDNASVNYSDEIQIIEKNKPLINKVEQCYHPREGLRWFSTTKIPITNEDGEMSGILGVSHDITDQILVKQDLEIAKEKAEVASTAKSNFLSNMSHEIRTPMNGVIGMAEVLNMTELDQEQKKIVNLIIRSGNNLLNIINDILDFSKIENGKVEIESIPIDLKSIIREVVELMMFSLNGKDVDLYYKIDPNIPELVIGDSLRIKQVLINLVSNAIKFTNEGEVIVEASHLGNSNNMNCVVFKVKDTGIGISQDEKVYLFAAFTQADTSTSRKYGGTGLGLAISSRLVEMMGGKLDVISEKGKGSTFFFDLCFKKVIVDDCDKI
jgi:two-component system sensor histidine kinase/response regulator